MNFRYVIHMDFVFLDDKDYLHETFDTSYDLYIEEKETETLLRTF